MKIRAEREALCKFLGGWLESIDQFLHQCQKERLDWSKILSWFGVEWVSLVQLGVYSI